jgi:ribosomal-protein-alanine N-acetyltransferase
VTASLSFDSRNRDDATAMLAGILERVRHDPRTEYFLAITPSDPEHMIGFARLGLDRGTGRQTRLRRPPTNWGQGIATDAACTLITFGFDEPKTPPHQRRHGTRNTASFALVTRLGFQYEGRIRHHVHTNGA